MRIPSFANATSSLVVSTNPRQTVPEVNLLVAYESLHKTVQCKSPWDGSLQVKLLEAAHVIIHVYFRAVVKYQTTFC